MDNFKVWCEFFGLSPKMNCKRRAVEYARMNAYYAETQPVNVRCKAKYR